MMVYKYLPPQCLCAEFEGDTMTTKFFITSPRPVAAIGIIAAAISIAALFARKQRAKSPINNDDFQGENVEAA